MKCLQRQRYYDSDRWFRQGSSLSVWLTHHCRETVTTRALSPSNDGFHLLMDIHNTGLHPMFQSCTDHHTPSGSRPNLCVSFHVSGNILQQLKSTLSVVHKTREHNKRPNEYSTKTSIWVSRASQGNQYLEALFHAKKKTSSILGLKENVVDPDRPQYQHCPETGEGGGERGRQSDTYSSPTVRVQGQRNNLRFWTTYCTNTNMGVSHLEPLVK